MKEKRGQVTIFIIIGLVIIGAAILLILFSPKIRTTLGLAQETPEEFIYECVLDQFETKVELISKQGGSLNPSPYYFHEGYNVQYLCYTNQNYEACTRQHMFLETGVESELKESLTPIVQGCFESLKENYEEAGYVVGIDEGEINFDLLPKKIVGTFNYELSLSKESTETHEDFSVSINNNLYELLKISEIIVESSIRYPFGIDPLIISEEYHFVDVYGPEGARDTEIYRLVDDETGGEFSFAIRSWVNNN